MASGGFKREFSRLAKITGATILLFGSAYFKVYRKIDGKRYTLRWVIEKKDEAEIEAGKLRREGYLVRVVPYGKIRHFRNLYAVYIRR